MKKRRNWRRRREQREMKKSTDDITSLIFKWTQVCLAAFAMLSDEKCSSLTVLFSSVGTSIFQISAQYLRNWF